jgi:hypothetical protein
MHLPSAKSILRSLLSIAVALIAVPVTHAQSGDITLDSRATPDQIQNWLLTSDPRLVAWGAHFAREHNDPAALALMPPLVARWTPPQDAQDQASRAQIPAITAILDALIQCGRTLPPETLSAIAPTFPTQAAILVARVPVTESTPLLLTWYYGQRAGKDQNHLARIAAMLLSHAPPPGFAATVLAESEETLLLRVVSAGSGESSGYGMGACGDSLGGGIPAGWPPVFTYLLEEDAQQESGMPVVAAAGNRISTLRHEMHGGWGTCNGVDPLNAGNRHHLLAQMLHINDDQMQWKANAFASIEWESNDQYVREATNVVAAEEAKLHATAKALQARSLLTADEAVTRPKLSVQIDDARKPAGEPLPQLRFLDSRTIAAPAPHSEPYLPDF